MTIDPIQKWPLVGAQPATTVASTVTGVTTCSVPHRPAPLYIFVWECARGVMLGLGCVIVCVPFLPVTKDWFLREQIVLLASAPASLHFWLGSSLEGSADSGFRTVARPVGWRSLLAGFAAGTGTIATLLLLSLLFPVFLELPQGRLLAFLLVAFSGGISFLGTDFPGTTSTRRRSESSLPEGTGN